MRVDAAVARAHGEPLRIESLDLADPGPGDILVRLVACGLGHLDWDAISGAIAVPLPFVPGGEGAGLVERTGDGVTGLEPGDTVFLDYAACGRCEACGSGRRRACVDVVALNLSGRRSADARSFTAPSGEVMGSFCGQSSFATHVLCRADSAIKLPNDAPLEIVASLGGEVLTGASVINDAFRWQRGDSLAITGAGVAGLVACLLAKDRGASTIVIADPDPRRRAIASECGATVAVQSDEELETTVKSLVGDGASFAFETTGCATAQRACRASLRPGGTMGTSRHAWLGDDQGETDDGVPIIVVDRAVVSRRLVPDLVRLHADGRFPIDRLVTFFPFPEVNDALSALVDGSVPKPVLRFPLGVFGDLDRAASEEDARERPNIPDDGETEDTQAVREAAESVKP